MLKMILILSCFNWPTATPLRIFFEAPQMPGFLYRVLQKATERAAAVFTSYYLHSLILLQSVAA